MTLPERALSLTWPWPYFMLELPEPYRKKIENRKPGFSHKSFRGESWVHQTPCRSQRMFYSALEFAIGQGVPRELLPSMSQFRGVGIVGRWKIVDLLDPPVSLPDRWRMYGQFGFVVEDARPVPFAPCGGALGFWRVKPETLQLLARST
jgi:hypothetical protein